MTTTQKIITSMFLIFISLSSASAYDLNKDWWEGTEWKYYYQLDLGKALQANDIPAATEALDFWIEQVKKDPDKKEVVSQLQFYRAEMQNKVLYQGMLVLMTDKTKGAYSDLFQQLKKKTEFEQKLKDDQRYYSEIKASGDLGYYDNIKYTMGDNSEDIYFDVERDTYSPDLPVRTTINTTTTITSKEDLIDKKMNGVKLVASDTYAEKNQGIKIIRDEIKNPNKYFEFLDATQVTAYNKVKEKITTNLKTKLMQKLNSMSEEARGKTIDSVNVRIEKLQARESSVFTKCILEELRIQLEKYR